MNSQTIDDVVKIRPWGAIVIENSILCDGKNHYGMDDGKNIACYTHVHEDHICGLEDALGRNNARVYATEITKELSSALTTYDAEWIKDRINYFGLKNNVVVNDDGLEISFRKAHHILGSAQLLVRSSKNSALYSSDFILQGTDIVKDVDYLILDSTHGRHSEDQKFEDVTSSKSKIIKKATEILEDSRHLIIYANRGTMQLVMSWLRKAISDDVYFLASRKNANLARVYSINGYPCGDIKDEEEFDKYYEDGSKFVRFCPPGLKLPDYQINSIRIGAASSTSLDDDAKQSIVNLQEHATVKEICMYVRDINPKHIVLDNSARTSNPDNATYLKDILSKMGFSASLSPARHPNTM